MNVGLFNFFDEAAKLLFKAFILLGLAAFLLLASAVVTMDHAQVAMINQSCSLIFASLMMLISVSMLGREVTMPSSNPFDRLNFRRAALIIAVGSVILWSIKFYHAIA